MYRFSQLKGFIRSVFSLCENKTFVLFRNTQHARYSQRINNLALPAKELDTLHLPAL